jgi:hypothetical protein
MINKIQMMCHNLISFHNNYSHFFIKKKKKKMEGYPILSNKVIGFFFLAHNIYFFNSICSYIIFQ